MDWMKAIETNRAALALIVEEIFALLELALTGKATYFSQARRTKVLGLLRPAESALRRLIIIMAKDVNVATRPSRPMPSGLTLSPARATHLRFQLFDARKRFGKTHVPEPKGGPRILFFGPSQLIPSHQPPAKSKASKANNNAAALCCRFAALKLALETLPQQAKRLARWRVRRKLMKNPKFTSPLRPGTPPGHRPRPSLPVDHLLAACHGLAYDAWRQAPS